jgi:ubiquinone/menaquinone biosynthesis C-methylase UbiE
MQTITENYLPGHAPETLAFMAARNLDSHGFFLAPLLQRGFHVLDVGCGPGTLPLGIAAAVFPGRVTGVDVAAAPLESARRLAEGLEIVNAEFHQASAYRLPFADDSFDVVFAHALFEHLREPRAALREMVRVTRPDGFVALCSPDWDHFDLTPFSTEVAEALAAYRYLQEINGGNTRAGSLLPEWLQETGFTVLDHGEWMEQYDDPHRIAAYLGAQLDRAGETLHAATLRDWASQPGAVFHQCWKTTTAIRAEDGMIPRGAEYP